MCELGIKDYNQVRLRVTRAASCCWYSRVRSSWKVASFGFVLVLVQGCTAPTKVVFTDVQLDQRTFVKDVLRADKYPAFTAAEGNIYSCRYGIRLLASAGFTPTKAQIFSNLLEREIPAIVERDVVLERFDVYYNRRLRTLGEFSRRSDMGAVATSIAGSAASQNQGVVTSHFFAIDVDPLTPRDAGNQVGCENAHEGEYYASEVAGGQDVLVTWLGFTLDGARHLFRTFYQFKPENPARIDSDAEAAIRMSIKALAEQLAPLSQ